MPNSAEPEGARTVGRVIRVLELIASESEPLRLVDIARVLDLPTSSAHALLQQLMKLDYVKPVGTERRYVQGPGLALLGSRVRSGLQIVRAAQAHAGRACRVDRREYLCRRAAGPRHCLRRLRRGRCFGVMARFPLGSPAAAACLRSRQALSRLSCAACQLDDFLGTEPLPAFTSHTTTDRAVLRQQLQDIRVHGYAVNEQEVVDDAFGVSAPIFDASRVLIGCVTIGMPGVRFKTRKKMAIEKVVMAAARRYPAAWAARTGRMSSTRSGSLQAAAFSAVKRSPRCRRPRGPTCCRSRSSPVRAG